MLAIEPEKIIEKGTMTTGFKISVIDRISEYDWFQNVDIQNWTL